MYVFPSTIKELRIILSFLPSCSMGDGVTYPTRTVDLDSDGLLGQRQRWMEEGDQGMEYV